MKAETKERIKRLMDLTECMIENFFNLICNKELVFKSIPIFYELSCELLEEIEEVDLELVGTLDGEEFLTFDAMNKLHTARASTTIMIKILKNRIDETDLYYELIPWIGGLG